MSDSQHQRTTENLANRGLRRLRDAWIRFWMRCSAKPGLNRLSYRMVAPVAPRFRAAGFLAQLSPCGYIDPTAIIGQSEVDLGRNIFIGESVAIHQGRDGGRVQLGDGVFLHTRTILETGARGEIQIGEESHIQPGCQLVSFEAPIRIGKRVQIGANCGLYSYDHGIAPGSRIVEQPLTTKGPITVEDDAWLGFGVVVLSGVRIGEGAVIGAGSVVVSEVPDGAIAVGVPARVVKNRRDLGV